MSLQSGQTTAWRAVTRVLRSTLLDNFASVLFPADCRVCGDPLCGFSRIPVCDSCWKNLPLQSGSLCPCCGESLGIVEDEALCRRCRLAAPAFEKAVAHGLYSGIMRSLLHLLKYDGIRPVAERFGNHIALQLAALSNLPVSMVVVPVPLFAARQWQRGFNQAELLARATVRAMRNQRPEWEGRLAGRVLRRQRATESQAGLSLSERRRNLRGAFFVSEPDTVKGRDVLLIDDIYTTGATARACAQVLRKAGAASVWVATAARAQRHDILYAPPWHEAKAETEVEMKRDVAFWNGSMALR